MTSDEDMKKILEEIRKDIDKRSRISVIDNFIDKPTVREVDSAIFDAVQDINSFAPMTSFTIESIHGSADGRWYRALTLGAARNVINMLILDWTAHGMSVDLGDGVSLDTKLGDYTSLHSLLTEEFEKLVERLKETTQRAVIVTHFKTNRTGSKNGAFSKRAANFSRMTRR
jgi:hypothetical protein